MGNGHLLLVLAVDGGRWRTGGLTSATQWELTGLSMVPLLPPGQNPYQALSWTHMPW
jgi:hypothetical protein